jgi:uncharacterized membrane protein
MYHVIKKRCVFVRGTLYAAAIFSVEYLTGAFLKKRDCCPWDYTHCRFHYKGLIRLDFYPLWFLAGLFFERVTVKKHGSGLL